MNELENAGTTIFAKFYGGWRKKWGKRNYQKNIYFFIFEKPFAKSLITYNNGKVGVGRNSRECEYIVHQFWFSNLINEFKFALQKIIYLQH